MRTGLFAIITAAFALLGLLFLWFGGYLLSVSFSGDPTLDIRLPWLALAVLMGGVIGVTFGGWGFYSQAKKIQSNDGRAALTAALGLAALNFLWLSGEVVTIQLKTYCLTVAVIGALLAIGIYTRRLAA